MPIRENHPVYVNVNQKSFKVATIA